MDDWQKKQKQMNKEVSNIPPFYKEAFQQLLDKLEAETGSKYQLAINKFGNYADYNYIIGDLKKRDGPILVYDMDSEYKELEGQYESIKEITQTIRKHKENFMFEETKEVVRDGEIVVLGKCRLCHSYNDNVKGRVPNYVDNIDCCQTQGCKRYTVFNKWANLQIDTFTGSIFTSGRGSVSVCHGKGKYKFVNV